MFLYIEGILLNIATFVCFLKSHIHSIALAFEYARYRILRPN